MTRTFNGNLLMNFVNLNFRNMSVKTWGLKQLFVFMALFANVRAGGPTNSTKPNIIFILADDLVSPSCNLLL